MKSEKFTFTKRISFGRFIKMSMLSALLTIWYSGLQAQCPLACNNLVQVSMDEDCLVEITADMMLEGQGVSPGCNYVVQVLALNGQPLAPPAGQTGNRWITSANVGQTLQVKVWLGANSCWGTIKIEDKLAPVINCPPTITVDCWDPLFQAGVTLTPPTATDNCGGNPVVTLLSDVMTDLNCDPSFRARRVLRYQAKDASGNLSIICERTIMFSRITLADVHVPKNYDGLPGHRPVLECDGTWLWNPNKSNVNVPFPTANWDRNNNGYPDPDETGAPFVRDNDNISGYINGFIVTVPPAGGGCVAGTLVRPEEQSQYAMLGCNLASFRIDTFYNPIIGTNNLCKINTTYSDTKLDICPKSYKILRAWTILDWCSGLLKTGHQVIKVVDSKGPIVTIPPDVTTAVEACVAAVNDNNTTGVTTANVSAVINADPYTCTGRWIASLPTIVFDCNTVTYEVEFALAEANGLPAATPNYTKSSGQTRSTRLANGRWELTGLPFGCTWIRYTIKDACDNISYGFTEIRVVDTTPPVPVCDETTVVTLSNNGAAIVFAESFDDGSHDNCTDVTYHVRRAGTCTGDAIPYTIAAGFPANLPRDGYGDFVRFCCADVGREIMVELRVSDAFGNVNTCMVLANVQDKVPPIITCPASVTINCGADTSATVLGRPVFSATPLSTPYFTDNCPDPRMSWRNSGTIDNCGQGVITRTFTVTDNGGRTATCTQTITVRNNTPYNGPTAWPTSPREVTGCMNVDTDPSKTGTPTIGAGACSQVAYTYEDQVFPFVDGVCFKILRKWTVIDWCKFAPNRDPSGNLYPTSPTNLVNSWTFTQVIKVSENDKPVIANTTKADTDAFGDNCNGFVDLKNSATDCTPAAQLRWSYTIDPNADGVAPFLTGTTNDASGTYPVGTHRITWVVEDMCGNQSTTSYTFRVLDKKKPTPYCISQLTTVVMPSTGSIEIWAKDFDKGSSDNCPVTSCGLRFTFNGFRPPVSTSEVLFNSAGAVIGPWPTTNASHLAGYRSGLYQRWLPSTCSSAKEYTCDDLGANSEDMSVWDAAGNTDYCTVTLNVQANGSACSGSRIAGDIGTEANEMVQNVSVLLQNMNSNESKANMTDNKGHYEFAGMQENAPYKITPEKNVDHLNGVSTLDLVMIQRHILGISKLTSPYKYMAADVNNDKNITASDLTELRKLILGIYAELPKNTSWRFLDKSVNVTDPLAIWNVNEYVHIDNFNNDMMTNHFVAVKVGDVNASATVNANTPITESRSAKILTLTADDKVFDAGETVKMPITAENFANIAGAQWTLNFDTKNIEFTQIESGAIKIDANNFNALQAGQGKLAFSWNEINGMTIDKNKVLFTIEFRATANNTISNTVKLTSDITKAEAYTQDLSEIKLGLSFRNKGVETFELSQNNPNPFTTTTNISFNLPQAGNATLTIFDITGKVLKTISGQYAKGRNEITLSAEDFDAKGVMLYELESNGQKSTKKMIYLSK